MKYMLDINILLRLIEITHQQHKEASATIAKIAKTEPHILYSSAKHLRINVGYFKLLIFNSL